ncbi:CPBP family intramembrane glutamic endopeptidase [Kordiimonas gwangyangensis]|uniref:CPBP family intramembrane glutamic endopeptidase n=1 Tax=Kordiimonas gwangyangensis TaxID=288022 RepID=UPI0003786BBF|nr:CPBP family intramembrane glutamic endopeptidase [Kordiimonas gwangyangensis]
MTGFPFLDRLFPNTDSRFVMAAFLMVALLVAQFSFALVASVMASAANGEATTGMVFPIALLGSNAVCFWIVWRNLHAPQHLPLASIGFIPSRVSMGTTLGLVLLLYLSAGMLAGLYIQLVDYEGQKATTEMIVAAGNDTMLAKILMMIAVVVIGPILEEIMFRGYLQSALTDRFSPAIGIAGSAFVFAAFHFQPEAFPLLALIGAACGIAYHVTQSLWPAVLLHMLNNAAFIVNLFYVEGQG